MNFSNKVRKLVTADGEKMNLTAEQKEALMKVQNAGNAEIYEGMATSVTAVEVSKAIEAAATAAQQSNTDVFASAIDLTTTKGHVIVPCATSKASNIVTGDLKEAVVMKAINTLEVRQVEGSTANAAIRNDKLMPFAAKSTEVTEDIVKKSSIRDFSMSGTMFPEDIRIAEELNAFIDFQHKYKSAMMAEFLVAASKKGLSEDQLLTIYRAASRSAAEDIFDQIWTEHHPIYDNSDPGEVSDYIDAKKAYMGTLETIGSKYMSSSSVRFGMSLRKVSIAPNPKWTAESKIGHVKQFGANKSYYVGSNIDSGIQTVPVTTTMLTNHMDNIVTIVRAGCALTEKEVRLENGLPADKIVVPEYSAIKYNTELLGKNYYELLGIDESRQVAIYERLYDAMKQKATTVIQAVDNRNNQNAAESLRALLGN